MTTFHEQQLDTLEAAPRRTSLMGIFSLVLGILSLVICCIPAVSPALGLVGVVLAVFALIAIAGSGGRLGGRALAIGGLVTSLIAVTFGGALLIGVAQGAAMIGQYAVFVPQAQADDPSKVVPMLAPEAVAKADAAGVKAFRTKTIDSLGRYQSVRGGAKAWIDAVTELARVEPTLQSFGVRPGGPTALPVPVKMDKGDATLIVIVDPNQKSGTMPLGVILNAGLMPPGNDPIWFIDPNAPAGTPAN